MGERGEAERYKPATHQPRCLQVPSLSSLSQTFTGSPAPESIVAVQCVRKQPEMHGPVLRSTHASAPCPHSVSHCRSTSASIPKLHRSWPLDRVRPRHMQASPITQRWRRLVDPSCTSSTGIGHSHLAVAPWGSTGLLVWGALASSICPSVRSSAAHTLATLHSLNSPSNVISRLLPSRSLLFSHPSTTSHPTQPQSSVHPSAPPTFTTHPSHRQLNPTHRQPLSISRISILHFILIPPQRRL